MGYDKVAQQYCIRLTVVTIIETKNSNTSLNCANDFQNVIRIFFNFSTIHLRCMGKTWSDG